jgi:hypothetical protein
MYKLDKNYSLYYLFGKNLILCLLEIYRIVALIKQERKENGKENKLVKNHKHNNHI